jgi:phospholipase C
MVLAEYELKGAQPTGKLLLRFVNTDPSQSYTLTVKDNVYGGELQRVTLGPITAADGKAQLLVETKKHGGWYDCSVAIEGLAGYERRYAGRVETGKDSISDPAMG